MNDHFLTALKSALEGTPASLPPLSREEWTLLFQLSEGHQVLPMIYEAVCHSPSLAEHPDLLSRVRQSAFRQITGQTIKTAAFLSLIRQLQSQGLRPLVVKGIVCRGLYPQPDARTSNDEDILIPEESFDAFDAALASHGMTSNGGNGFEVTYDKPGSPLYIELHKSLFPPESTVYGDFNRFFEDVHNRAVCLEVDGTPLWTLSPTDHLFYLICHAYKHFLHSGFGIRQVCDIILYTNAHGQQIDWEWIVHNCRAIHAEGFCMALFRIGRKYLTLDDEKAALPGDWQTADVDESLMLQDLLDGGVFGDATMSRKHSSTITLDAVSAEKQGKRTRSSVLASLFPPASALAGRFPYLNKAPWLLPLAWIQRILRYRQERPGASAEALKIGKERVELMRAYGIIK